MTTDTETETKGKRQKRQPELPATESEADRELADVCGADLEAREEKKRAADKAKEAYEAAKAAMLEAERKLPRDKRGNPVYVYRDGDKSIAYKLTTKRELITEVLDDGGPSGEIG